MLNKQEMSGIKIALALIVISFFILGIFFIDKNSKFNTLLSEYNKLNEEYEQLKADYEEFPNAQEVLADQVKEKTQEGNSFIQNYHGMKYPVTSGLRKYIGEEPLRIYPNSKAPYVYEEYKPEIVELINEVGMKKEKWCLVLDSKGVSGYAHSSDLVTIDEEKIDSHDYGSGIETLGGFKVGDRIETLLGLLERDYCLIYENGRIYQFPDNKSEEVINHINPIDIPFSNIHSLDAFVRDTNRVSRLRTDSSEFPLVDGYKVGDDANEVLNFYASKYDYLDDNEFGWYSEYTYIIEDGHMLEFKIDTEKLNENSIIASICID